MRANWTVIGCGMTAALIVIGCGGHKSKRSGSTVAPATSATTQPTAPVSSGSTTGPIATTTVPVPQPPVAQALQAVLQLGPLDGKDTYVRSDGLYHNDNFGVAGEVLVGDRDSQRGDFRVFIEHSLASIPAGSTIRSAKLALYVTGFQFHDEDLTVRVHRVIPTQNKNGQGITQTPWKEGTSTNDANLDGLAWDGAYALGTVPTNNSQLPRYTQPDVDETSDYGFGATGIVDEIVILRGTANQWVEVDITPAVAMWVAGVENHGVRLSHSTEGAPWLDGLKRIASSDNVDATRRPRLTVDYDAPAGSEFLSLQPGPANGKDTWIRNEGLYDNDNYGASGSIVVGDRLTQSGDRRAYLQFDVTPVPAGKTIVKATLELFHYATTQYDTDVTIRAFKVIPTSNKNGQGADQTPWIEGTTTNDAALDGMSWDGDLATGSFPVTRSNHPEYTQPNVDETTNYGNGPTGVLDEIVMSQGQLNHWVPLDVTGAVRDWVAGAENHGLRLMHNPEGSPFTDGSKHFYASDVVGFPARRPVLRIEYR